MIKYHPRISVIHSLPPLVKFLGLVLILLVSILFVDLKVQLSLLAFVLVIIFVARLPLKPILEFSTPFLVLAFLLVVFQTLTYPYGRNIFVFGLRASLDGFMFGLILALRLVVISTSVPLLLMTTKQSDLAKSLKLFLPGFLVVSLVLMFRFIPIFQEELLRIKCARESRGSKSHISGIHSIIAPLFFKAVERARNMSLSLESRGFEI